VPDGAPSRAQVRAAGLGLFHEDHGEQSYFNLHRAAAKAIKDVDASLWVGGPATSSGQLSFGAATVSGGPVLPRVHAVGDYEQRTGRLRLRRHLALPAAGAVACDVSRGRAVARVDRTHSFQVTMAGHQG